MPYIDNQLQIAIADVLGLQGLHTDQQVQFGESFILNYYWISYLRQTSEESEIKEWVVAIAKTNHWQYGLVSSVNGLKSLLIDPKRVNLKDLEDLVILHLKNLDTVADLDDTLTLDGEHKMCEILFETTRTFCHLTIKHLPIGNYNLESLWHKLEQTRDYLIGKI